MAKFKRAKVVALACVLALGLSACGSGGGSDEELSGELNLFLIPSPSSTAIQSFIPEFEEKTGVKVNVSETPYGEAHQKQLLSYNQKAGAYDIAQFDNSFLAPFCQAQAMTPLGDWVNNSSEYDINDFGKGQQDYGKCANGDVYGLTLSTEPMIQWYRTDIYEKLGLQPATTWDEWYANAKKVQDSGAGGQLIGFGPNVSWWWMTMVWSFGGKLYDENLNPTVNSPEAIAAVDYMKKLLSVSPKVLSPLMAMKLRANSSARKLERCLTIPVITEWRLILQSTSTLASLQPRQCQRGQPISPTLLVGISESQLMPRIQMPLGLSLSLF